VPPPAVVEAEESEADEPDRQEEERRGGELLREGLRDRVVEAQAEGEPVPERNDRQVDQEDQRSTEAQHSLQPGDMIRVDIWREPDLSGTFPVNDRGVVTLPLLGRTEVVNLALDELQDRLIEAYQVHLRNPSINITPLRRINILGEVGRPGLYEVDPTVSLAGVIGLAGGVTPAGDMDRIRIIRGGEVLYERVGAASTVNAADVRSGDQIVVLQRSWFERNSTFVVSLVLSVTSIVLGLLN
jgi:protein involved in polysaccharide export with SLBB domain